MKLKEVILVIILVIVDLVTKFYFQANLALGESISVLGEFFKFTYATNTGAAWSILEGKMGFFYLVTLAMTIVMVGYLVKSPNAKPLERIAIAMMIGGTLGNFYDRLVFQYVRDFLDFNLLGYDFPIFNLADTFLSLGVGLLFIAWFVVKKEEKDGA